MKKRTKIILIAVLALVVLVFFGRRNFEKDKNQLLQLKNLAANGNVLATIDKIEENPDFTNLPIILAYNKWKANFYSRFVDQDEVIEPTTDNKIINDISNIFRDYWADSSLEKDKQEHLDSKLTSNLYEYLQENNLTDLTRPELEKSSFEEVKKLIKKQGAYSQSFYLNETYGIKIWDKQTEQEYTIELPLDTLTITIVFIENYLLRGTIDYMTMGSGQDGGWSSNYDQRLYCKHDEYASHNSEKFQYSYLKHEANHFVDGERYPNLSTADLEYRSKLIEFMYTKNRVHTLIAEFMNAGSNENRNNAHAYANYTIIKHFSEEIFNTAREEDMDKWKEISVERINELATKLYENNNQLLNSNKLVDEII